MKRTKLVRCLSIGVIASLGMGLLSGCTGKNVDYNIEGVTEDTQTETDEGKSGVGQFADAPAWNEMWTIQREEEEPVSVEVDADIQIPKVAQMSVVEVVEPEMDAEYKERIAKRLFGDSEIYYNDFTHLPRKEFEEAYAYYESMYQSSSGDERDEWAEEMEVCETALEHAKDTYTLAEEYTVDDYLGYCDGIPYELYFLQVENEAVMENTWKCKTKAIYWEPKDIYEICPEECKDYKELSYLAHPNGSSSKENECEISEEEAEKTARKFVENLGLEYPVLSRSQPLIWGDNQVDAGNIESWYVNGYVFTYDYGVDDLSFVDYGVDSEYMNLPVKALKGEGLEYSMTAEMSVCVTDNGVIQMMASNPVETVGISEYVELLPLETIQGIIKEQMEKQYNVFRFDWNGDTLKLDSMELIYFRVRDKENQGHYSYVPAWRLSLLSEDIEWDVKNIENPVIINAIDGSVIDIYNET